MNSELTQNSKRLEGLASQVSPVRSGDSYLCATDVGTSQSAAQQ
jgi:hypothetical protein